MSKIQNDNFLPQFPKALDQRQGKFVAGTWLPFDSIIEALTLVPAGIRAQTLSLPIKIDGVARRYWFKNGILDTDLVEEIPDFDKPVFALNSDFVEVEPTIPIGYITPIPVYGLAASVTKAGNTFNSANQLVKMTENNKLPAIDGSLLINLPISGGGSGGTAIGYFNVKTYGALGDGVTDNTIAIQTAINAAFAAGGGVVYFPHSTLTYKVSGALVTSLNGVNPNCQLYIPLAGINDKLITIVFKGEKPPHFSEEGISSVTRSTQGSIIESTITGIGVKPSVIGTTWASTPIGLRNYIDVVFEDIEIRTSTLSGTTNIAGTMCGINLERGITFQADGLKLSISSTLFGSVLPSNPTYGIIMPDVNNKVVLPMGVVYITGYNTAIKVGEHANFKHLITVGNVTGIEVPDGYHAVSIQHYTAEINRYNITFAGTMNVNIFTYETEHYTANDKWYTFIKDVRYISGTSNLRIFASNIVESGIGNISTFISDLTAPTMRIFNGAGENVTYGAATVYTFLRLAGGGGTISATTPLEISNNFSIKWDMKMTTTNLAQAATYVMGVTTQSGVSFFDFWNIIYNFTTNDLEFYGGDATSYTGANPRTVVANLGGTADVWRTYEVLYDGTNLSLKINDVQTFTVAKTFSLLPFNTYSPSVPLFHIGSRQANANWQGDIRNIVLKKAGVIVTNITLAGNALDTSGNGFNLALTGGYSFN